MPEVTNGNSISLYAGETLLIELSVLDRYGVAADLTGAVAIFGLRSRNGTVTQFACSIVGNLVSIEMSSATTALWSGDYSYEFRLRLMSGKVDSLIIGSLSVKKGILTTIAAPE